MTPINEIESPITQSNLQVYIATPIKIPMTFLIELEQIILKFTRTQKTPNNQSSFKKERSWRYHVPRFQTTVQNYSNQKHTNSKNRCIG